MKRRVYLTIDIDTECEGSTLFFRHQHDDDVFSIEVRKGTRPHLCDVVTPFASLAHELGHFLGTLFRLPGQMLDPRMAFTEADKRAQMSYSILFGLGNGDQRVLRSEAEAWDVAECLFSIDKARRVALDTYQEKLPAIFRCDKLDMSQIIKQAGEGNGATPSIQ